MKAEIIAVGSELLTPYHTDTNSLFLTEKLNQAGFEVHLKTIVGDNETDIAGVLQAALGRSDVIVFSGGLGPTEDDLTRPAVAKVLGRKLQIDAQLLEALRKRFASRNIPMASINERQAQIIEQAEILRNPFGTAPGLWLRERDCCIALLPGPPRELMPMFESHVMPRLVKLGQGRLLARKTLRVTGMNESEVDSTIAPIYKSYPRVQTTILAASGYIAINLHQWVLPGDPPADLEASAAQIQARLGDAVFTTSEQPLEEVVGRLLRDSGRTLAVAESCTSGLLGMRITRIPGSSDYFLGGILCYSNEAKKELCRVPREILEKHGAVSAEVAEELARGVRDALHSSIGLAITGIAGPGGGSAEKPVGLVYVGLSEGERVEYDRRIIPGDREAIRERAAALALSLLRRFLLQSQK
jgi:nicotinamide-nucleotide amidase